MNPSRFRAAAAAVPIVWFAACPLAAQDVGDLEEVTVTGRRLEETIPLDLGRFGNRVEILTSQTLELGGFADVGQTLQMEVPGLYVAPKNGAFDYVDCSLQGSRCQDILWLVDGVRINNRLYNSTSPLDTVPAHMVERIEVLYGGQGIFYGTQAVAGVVNVVTKSFAGEPDVNLGIAVDSNDGTHVDADYRTAFGDHRLALYGSSDDADGFRPFRDDAYQPSATDRERSYDVSTLGLKYAYAFSEASRLTLHYHHTDAELDFAAPANTAFAFNDRDEDLVTAKWDYAPSENVDLFVKAYYHWWDTLYTNVDNELDADGNLTGGLVANSLRDFWGYEDYGLTAMARIRAPGGLEYAVGVDRQEFSGRDDVLLIADRTEHVNAVFGQLRAGEEIFDNTRIALGFRHNMPSGEGEITVGSLTGRHEFSNGLYLRGGLGTSFRLPDAYQLYGNDPCCTQGNPNLEGEKGRNFDIALGGGVDAGADLGWEVTLFDREIDNLIASDGVMQVNTANTVEFSGLEVTLSVGITEALSTRFSYVDTTAEEEGTGEQIAGVPESTFKAGVTLRPEAAPYDLGASLIAVGDVYDTVSGGLGRREHGGYTVLDLTAGLRFGRDETQRIGLRLENALDEEYATSLGRAFVDATGDSYAYANLGTPRTVHLTYDYGF